MNYYTYYTEHTLYNRDYPDIAPPNDLPRRYTHQMLMANLQCFGHFEETLKIPFYDNIKDSPFNIDPSKEESYTLLRSQIANTLKQYPKPSSSTSTATKQKVSAAVTPKLTSSSTVPTRSTASTSTESTTWCRKSTANSTPPAKASTS